MATNFPISEPGALFEQSMADNTDLYQVLSGPLEKKGWGPVRLCWVQTDAGEPIDNSQLTEHLKQFEGLDPQEPKLLSYRALAIFAINHQVELDKLKQQETDEFDQLVGSSPDMVGDERG